MISIELHQRSDYQFDIQFGAAVPALLCDEPEPLGQGLGPSPVQLLAAAVGNCLSDCLYLRVANTSSRQNRCARWSRRWWVAMPKAASGFWA